MMHLCEARGAGLPLAHEIYAYALAHVAEFCAPYASVIDIDKTKLPSAEVVRGWSGPRFASALRHIPTHPDFNANGRQLVHVSLKVAAKHGTGYTVRWKANAAVVRKKGGENIDKQHLQQRCVG